jgi:hypothetical protein
LSTFTRHAPVQFFGEIVDGSCAAQFQDLLVDVGFVNSEAAADELL